MITAQDLEPYVDLSMLWCVIDVLLQLNFVWSNLDSCSVWGMDALTGCLSRHNHLTCLFLSLSLLYFVAWMTDTYILCYVTLDCFSTLATMPSNPMYFIAGVRRGRVMGMPWWPYLDCHILTAISWWPYLDGRWKMKRVCVWSSWSRALVSKGSWMWITRDWINVW